MKRSQSLLANGSLDAQQMRIASQAQATDGGLARVARQLGFASEEEAIKAVGKTLGLDYVDLSSAEIDLTLLDDFPVKLIHRHVLFPLYRDERSGSLVVATGDPFDLHAVDAVGTATGLSIVPVLTVPGELAKLIKTHLGVGAETIDGLLAQREQRDDGVQISPVSRRPRGGQCDESAAHRRRSGVDDHDPAAESPGRMLG